MSQFFCSTSYATAESEEASLLLFSYYAWTDGPTRQLSKKFCGLTRPQCYSYYTWANEAVIQKNYRALISAKFPDNCTKSNSTLLL